jgi:hypothetical protein
MIKWKLGDYLKGVICKMNNAIIGLIIISVVYVFYYYISMENERR